MSKAATSITSVTASQAVSYGTASITLGGTVNLYGAGAYPTGTVTVSIDGVQATSSSISSSDGSFSATFNPNTIPASSTPYAITYSYAGDSNYNAATSNATTTLTVNQAATSISGVTASPTVSFGTASLTLSGTVNKNGAGAYPTGKVLVSIDGVQATSSSISSSNGSFSATFNPSTIPASGTAYTITYSYAGNSDYSAAANNISTTLTVNKAATSITGVTASQGVTYGAASLALGGTVNKNASGAYPTGTVTVSIDGVNATSSNISSSNGSFSAAFNPSSIPASGTAYTITYSYVGDSNYNAANNTSTTLTVNKAATSISGVTASQVVTYGTASLALSGTVNKNASGAYPTGTVTVSIDGVNATSSSISSSNGNFSTAFNPSSIPAAGTAYTITYSYAGDSNYNAPGNNTSTTLTINKSPLTITADNDSKVYGASKSFSGTAFTETGLVTGNGDGIAGVTETSTGSAASAPVGSDPIVASAAMGTGLSNYNISYVPGTLTVTPAPLTITANDESMTYGGTMPALTVSYTGLVGGDTPTAISGMTTYPTASTAPASSQVGTYTISAGGAVDPDYTINYATGTLTVAPAVLTITANNESMTYGGTMPALTVSYTGLVDGDTPTAISGMTTYPTASTVPASSQVGSYAISTGGAVDPDYTISYVPGTLTVTPAVLTITANNESMTYGGTMPALTVSYTGLVNGDTPTAISGMTTYPAASTVPASSQVGNYTISAGGAVDPDYAISYAAGTLMVTPAPLTITANNESMTYGGTMPALTVSYTGLVGGDTPTAISGMTTYPTASTVPASSQVGSYAISAGGAVDPDYSISYAPGTLTVTPAPLTITADNESMTYGSTMPALTVSYTGLVNGDTSTAISGMTTYPTASTVPASSQVGSYAISAGGAVEPDYSISYAPGTLTVTPAPLTVTADNQSITYGGTMPALTVSYTGLVNGDTPTAISGMTTYPTASTVPASSQVGSYTISAGGAVDPDYTISYATGTLTVTPAPLTITADNESMTYGGTMPALTVSYAGFVNGDTPASLSTQPTLSTTATAGSHVAGSPYSIMASGAADANYTISYVAGALTVTPAPLTITADNQSMVYGTALPSLTASYSGFVNGDTPASLSTPPTLSTPATADSDVSGSPYSITASGAADADYTISYVPGTLTVTQETLTVDSVQTLDSLDASSNVAIVIGSGGDLVVGSPITLDSAGAVSVVQSGVLTVPGINSQSGASGITFDSGTLQASADFSTTAPITLGAGGGMIDANGNNLALAGGISGVGGLTTTGPGVVTLSGTNSYTGGTVVSAGTLIATSPSAIAAGTSLVIGAGGTFNFDPSLEASPSVVVAATPSAVASSPVVSVNFVTPTAASVVDSAGEALAQSSATAATSAVALPQPASPPAANDSPAGGSTPLPTAAPAALESQTMVLRTTAPGVSSSSQSVPAAASCTLAVDRSVLPSVAQGLFRSIQPSPPAPLPVGDGYYGDLAGFEQSENSSDGLDNSDPNHERALAILALDAVFAQYGR